MIAQLTIGSENVEMSSAKVHAFVFVNGEELHITKAQARSAGVVRVGSASTQDAVPGMRWEVCGGWTTANYEIPAGVPLKLFATRKVGFGAMPETHSAWCVLDAAVDHVELRIDTSGASRCAVSWVTMLGRFRWLSLTEAEALTGRATPAMFRSQFYPMTNPDALIRVHRVVSAGVRQNARAITASEAIGQRAGMVGTITDSSMNAAERRAMVARALSSLPPEPPPIVPLAAVVPPTVAPLPATTLPVIARRRRLL